MRRGTNTEIKSIKQLGIGMQQVARGNKKLGAFLQNLTKPYLKKEMGQRIIKKQKLYSLALPKLYTFKFLKERQHSNLEHSQFNGGEQINK